MKDTLGHLALVPNNQSPPPPHTHTHPSLNRANHYASDNLSEYFVHSSRYYIDVFHSAIATLHTSTKLLQSTLSNDFEGPGKYFSI